MTAFKPPPAGRLWALVQTKPRKAVLMVSSDRSSLLGEAAELAAIQNEIGERTRHQWRVVRCEMAGA